MTGIYLVNIGANQRHRLSARSPIFDDSSFVYVPYPKDDLKATEGICRYLAECRPYTRDCSTGHLDPNWSDRTYGDIVSGGRGGNLRNVVRGDILLFWGMLWKNSGNSWRSFTNSPAWYLMGAIRVEYIVKEGNSLRDVPIRYQSRLKRNAHCKSGTVPKGHTVFVGSRRHSGKFSIAVPLEFDKPNGLAYRTCTAATGELLMREKKPHWRSSLRACRKIWDLDDLVQRRRAILIRNAVRRLNDWDILEGV